MPMSSCLTPGADHARQADLGSMSVEPVTGKAEQLVLLQAVTFDSSCCPRMLPQVLEHFAKIARINLIYYDRLAEWNGGVIQRLKAGHYSVSVVIHDGQNRAVCAAGCDSR